MMEDMRRRIDEIREACRLAGVEARRKGEGVRVGGGYVYLFSPPSHSPEIPEKNIKVILLTKNQFKNYSKFLEKFPRLTTKKILKGMAEAGYQESEYGMFKGIPVVTFAKEDLILRDFTSLSENDFSQWKDEVNKISYLELNNAEQLTGGVVMR